MNAYEYLICAEPFDVRNNTYVNKAQYLSLTNAQLN